jgi:stress response protein YsnF
MTASTSPDDESTDAAAPEADPVLVIRHEQRLHVDTVRTPTHRVRIQKYLVTEERMIPVTFRREEVRVIEEPLDPGDIADLQGQDGQEPAGIVTVILHEERPVIALEVVPVETVRVSRQMVTTTREYTGDVLVERVDVHTDLPGHIPMSEQGPF